MREALFYFSQEDLNKCCHRGKIVGPIFYGFYFWEERVGGGISVFLMPIVVGRLVQYNFNTPSKNPKRILKIK